MDYDEREYADYLNDIYGDIEICGIEYPAGNALFDVDPIAFRTGMADWAAEGEDEEDA